MRFSPHGVMWFHAATICNDNDRVLFEIKWTGPVCRHGLLNNVDGLHCSWLNAFPIVLKADRAMLIPFGLVIRVFKVQALANYHASLNKLCLKGKNQSLLC